MEFYNKFKDYKKVKDIEDKIVDQKKKIYCICEECNNIVLYSFKNTKFGQFREKDYIKYNCLDTMYEPLNKTHCLKGEKYKKMNCLFIDHFAINRNNRMLNEQDLYLVKYINDNINKNMKVLEIGAGIGQSSFALDSLGFKDVSILECVNRRIYVSKKIIIYNNLDIKLFTEYFENLNQEVINTFGLIFTNNMGNFHKIEELEKTITTYANIFTNFLNSSDNKDIILPLNAFGLRGITAYLILYKLLDNNNLYFDTFYANNSIETRHNFVRISNYKFKEFLNFSNDFKNYYLINSKNIDVKVVNDIENNIFLLKQSIKIDLLKGEKNTSFGIYFTKKNTLSKKELDIPKDNPHINWLDQRKDFLKIARINNSSLLDSYELKMSENFNKIMIDGVYTFIFYARSSYPCKIKVYTGEKWIFLEKKLTINYQKYSIRENFKFSGSSTNRIGIQEINTHDNISIFLLNPEFKKKLDHQK